MCGRYTQTQSGKAIAAAFGLSKEPQPQPRYNIAPSQPVSAIAQPGTTREYRIFQWGLVPSWSKDPSIGSRMINARAETAAEKPSFRAAFKRRRCLIVADGFYEWQKSGGSVGKQKQPYYIQLEDQSLFGFAGLWEQWESGDGSYLETCTILTTEPNDLMQTIHNRMPVILHPQDYDTWLDPDLQTGRSLQPLLRPYEAAAMQAYPVSTMVNSPRNETPACIEPLPS
ncbi:MAG: SOS response-associated peptidase [Cyanobacteria bacterium P01_A01_bin.114]